MPVEHIRTTGDLREFLGGVLISIRDGSLDTDQANAIAKVASQMNLSISVEVNAAIQLERLGKGHAAAGTMLLTSSPVGELQTQRQLLPADQDGLIWCDQCDMRVSPDQANGCKSRHCKAMVQ